MKKKKISRSMFVICMKNTAIITINTIKTITVAIMPYFVSAIILYIAHFPMLFYEESNENLNII